MLKTLSIILVSFLVVIGISYVAHLKLEEVSAENFSQGEQEISTEDQLKDLFAKKYSLDSSIIELVNVEESTNYATGGVKLGEGPGNAGHFLSVKEDGLWKLAFDGNGSYSCESIKEYSFLPEEIASLCY